MVEIEHPVRVDARRAAAVYRALGMTHTYVERIAPRSMAECLWVLERLAPDTASSVHFAKGTQSPELLERVVTADGGKAMYADVAYGNAHIRCWPDHAWVQIERYPSGGIETAARIIEETTGLVAPATLGKHVLGPELLVELGEDRPIDWAKPHLAIYVRMLDRARAFALFRRLADPAKRFGWVSAPSEAALPHLRTYVEATGGEIAIELLVPVEVAAEITERGIVDAWQAGDLLYTPESGVLYTYMLAPVAQDAIDAWIATIDSALQRIA